ncbi:lipid A-modifier LpxR family protein [Brevundimonas sp. LM2]|uniref:lipid A-modifier LpxR family protein n=1 Tax=Brevundimonas sp. LM2 TaxID=1938605 RepID=UPI00209AD469|nr:lipid A-modifier LpxR family protein [Brevundimonas sp. LM2]
MGQTWTTQTPATAGITTRLNTSSAFGTASAFEIAAADAVFGPAVALAEPLAASTRTNPFAASTTRDVWIEGAGHADRLRVRARGELRRADGGPLPPSLLNPSAFEADGYDVSFARGWPVARGYTASGLEVTLTPHAGIGVGDRGGLAEAGATLKIGKGLDRLVRDGQDAFGERARWYIYAAGSGTAVGYNFARNRDGDYARSGVSRDSGTFLGDASVGVALRRGDLQGSFGLVYREIEAEGMSGHGIDKDVTEGLVAFQFSISPQW